MSEQKIEQFWRDATADDVARWMKGEDVKSRFWHNLQCPHEVYDPPQWWLNKPDPGKGYKLLGKFPDEELKKGDEWLRHGEWKETERPYTGETKQSYGVWYRRRIETIKICDVAKIAGHSPVATNNDFRKFVDKAQAGELSFTCSFVWEGPESIKVKVGDRIQHPNGCWLEITETGFKVNATLDTVEFGK
jgi:hypothetical protein